MSHIHTKPGQHDFTASAFIIRTDGTEPRAMVHMHKKTSQIYAVWWSRGTQRNAMADDIT